MLAPQFAGGQIRFITLFQVISKSLLLNLNSVAIANAIGQKSLLFMLVNI